MPCLREMTSCSPPWQRTPCVAWNWGAYWWRHGLYTTGSVACGKRVLVIFGTA